MGSKAMQIKDCSCPEPIGGRPVSLSSAILTYCCPQCGGGVAAISDWLHGITQLVEQMKADLYEALGDVTPPGRAIIMTCSECEGRGCEQCGQSGQELWRACPKCGDIGFDFINGQNDADGMACRIGCGFKWAADDPRWLVQRLPANVQAA